MSVTEPEIAHGLRAWADSQVLLGGEPSEQVPASVLAGWHDTSVSPHAGAFALVGLESELEDWIGEVLRVQIAGRTAYVYVLGSADVPTPLSLSRRAFAALAPLYVESRQAQVWVVG